MARVVEFFVQSQNGDGGWGYAPRRMSYVEPTALVVLALEGTARADTTLQVDAPLKRGRDFLVSLQHSDGGWGIGAIDPESGWMTAWAVSALSLFPDVRPQVQRGSQWLRNARGWQIDDPTVRAQSHDLYDIDPALRGWPWQLGDASWVHPTALAVLALCSAAKDAVSDIQDGVAFLMDRAVASGGWNMGNPQMIGKEIPATVEDTAVALRALHAAGQGSGDEGIARGIRFLSQLASRTKSARELAWSLYGLQGWSTDAGDALDRLRALQRDDGSWGGDLFTTAVAQLALLKRGK